MSETKSLTLYEVEEHLQAFVETEEGGVDPEQLQEFALELAAAKEAAVAKRDGCIRFIQHLEAQIDFAKAEKSRINTLQKRFEGALDRFKAYLVGVIEMNVPPPKRGAKKLEGSVGVMSLRKLPDRVEVATPESVPYEYQDVAVTLDGRVYGMLLDVVHAANREDLVTAVRDASTFTPRKKQIKDTILAGGQVAGADIVFGQNTLAVK